MALPEPGSRSAINSNDANYFTPSAEDVRIAAATRERRVTTLDEVKRVLALALVAFARSCAHSKVTVPKR
jgi:hypothetical protein